MPEKKCPFALPLIVQRGVGALGYGYSKVCHNNGEAISGWILEEFARALVEAVNDYYGDEKKEEDPDNIHFIPPKVEEVSLVGVHKLQDWFMATNRKLDTIISKQNSTADITVSYDAEPAKLQERNAELEGEVSELKLRLHASKQTNSVVTSDRDKFKIMYDSASKKRGELEDKLIWSEQQLAELKAEKAKPIDQLRGEFGILIREHTCLTQESADRLFDTMVNSGFLNVEAPYAERKVKP